MKFLVFTFSFGIFLHSQVVNGQKYWSLSECIAYAVKQNVTIESNALDVKLTELQLKQSKLSQLPSAQLNINGGKSFGRSIDPTTNQFVNSSYNFFSPGISSGVLLFGWFQKKYDRERLQYSLEANKVNNQKLENDLTLNIVTSYLRILLANHQLKIVENQINYTQENIRRTTILVETGKLPPLNLLQVQAQLASDSSNLISAQNNHIQELLKLQALMNFPFDENFMIVVPEIKEVDLELPDKSILLDGLENNVLSLKSSQYTIKSLERATKLAKSQMFPQLTGGFNYGSSYSSRFVEPYGNPTYSLYQTPYFVETDTIHFVYGYNPTYNLKTIPLFSQIGNNRNYSVVFGLSVPLFNGYATNSMSRSSQINYKKAQLQYEQLKIQTQQEVLLAYQDAINSFGKYQSSRRALELAQSSFNLAKQRYELGLMNFLEYRLENNNFMNAQLTNTSAVFEYIFKRKLLDYYLGKEIRNL